VRRPAADTLITSPSATQVTSRFILMVGRQLTWADESQARVLDGPSMQLASAEGPYEVASFMRSKRQMWNWVKRTDEPQGARGFARREIALRTSVRMTERQEAVELHLPVSIGLIEDPAPHCSGPIRRHSGILVVLADGANYKIP
jgi:hypothetical protein